VIGLDCASPDLIFDQFRADLPTFSRLMNGGTWGALASCIPCITVPAWAVMLSSRDPGVLGVYGFRNRADHSYAAMTTADSTSIRVPRVWDTLSDAGRESVILGVPPTYPVRPLNGHMVSCFLTPNVGSAFAYPAIFKNEVLKRAPDYAFDVKDFRTDDKARLYRQLLDLTAIQHDIALHTLKTKSWDCLIHVNIALDRVHHGFWRFHDPLHRAHEPNSPFRDAIRDYYKLLDQHAAALIAAADDALILVVSDHGVKRMDGGICFNEWLWRTGWLALQSPPPAGRLTRFEDADINWSRTRAWSSGGYYARLFLNVRGREPEGVIAPDALPAVKRELTDALMQIPDPDGRPFPMQVYAPEAIYQTVNGIAPDLIAYAGDLHWRAVGSLGHGRDWTFENDTGQDDANHAQAGMFILYDPSGRARGRVDGAGIMDIAPTILDRMGVKVPRDMQGRVL
jgi:predicted AlkP superfamily phosphohydrolase/phosphomutase